MQDQIVFNKNNKIMNRILESIRKELFQKDVSLQNQNKKNWTLFLSFERSR